MPDDWQQGGFGVYIHWPFCLAKCPYCDFNSHVRRDVDQALWRKALLTELRDTATRIGPRKVDTVFFGGGTPSLMDPETVHALVQEIDQLWGLKDGAEISLEANPTSVEADRFSRYAQAGVNRLSMGIQALNDRDLKALGRMHSAQEAMQAFDIAKKHFDRVSFDLIYARQRQSVEDWQIELKKALNMSVDHLSLYQLTIEGGTRFGDLYDRGKLRNLPDDDAATDMYFQTQEICENAGMPRYEVSNHSGPDAQSRHNLIYWRYGDYVGIGPGAHGRLTIGGKRHASQTHLNPENWLESVKFHGHGRTELTELTLAEQATEYLLMSMRLSEGIGLSRYSNLAGGPLDKDSLEHLEGLGFVTVSGNNLRATSKGAPLLNAILRALV